MNWVFCRLEGLDNLGRRASATLDEEYATTLPDPTGYKDINSDSEVPHVSIDAVRRYYSLYSKTIEQKYDTMYKEKYLRYLRMNETGAGEVAATLLGVYGQK